MLLSSSTTLFGLLMRILINFLVLSYCMGAGACEQDRKGDAIDAQYQAGRSLLESPTGVTIDVAACTEDRRVFFADLGSTTLVVAGRRGDYCQLYYGTEMEQPRWSGQLPYQCNIPVVMGRMDLHKGRQGLDVAPLQAFCRKARKSQKSQDIHEE